MKSQGKHCLTWSEFSFCQILSSKYMLQATEAYIIHCWQTFLEFDCSGLSHESRSNVLDVGERRVFYLSLALPIIHLRLLGNTARTGPNPINPPILFLTEPSPWNVNTWLNSIICCNQSSIYYDNGCDSNPFTKSGFEKRTLNNNRKHTGFVTLVQRKNTFCYILSQIFLSMRTKPWSTM